MNREKSGEWTGVGVAYLGCVVTYGGMLTRSLLLHVLGGVLAAGGLFLLLTATRGPRR